MIAVASALYLVTLHHTTEHVITKLELKVVPGASRSEIAGWLGDKLKVRVAAPPEKGKANAQVEALLAKALGLPSGSVYISAGKTSQYKLASVEGLSAEQVEQKLGAPK